MYPYPSIRGGATLWSSLAAAKRSPDALELAGCSEPVQDLISGAPALRKGTLQERERHP